MIFLLLFISLSFISGWFSSFTVDTSDSRPIHRTFFEGDIITTKKMLYATPTENDFNFLLKIRNDEEAMKQMLLNGRLVPFAPGAKFYIMDRNTSQDYVKIRQEGSLIELYTHSKFLE